MTCNTADPTIYTAIYYNLVAVTLLVVERLIYYIFIICKEKDCFFHFDSCCGLCNTTVNEKQHQEDTQHPPIEPVKSSD